MVTVCRLLALGLLLLAAATARAQNSYNWWDARPPAPVTPPMRPARKPSSAPTPRTSVVVDSLPLTTGGHTYVDVMPAFPGGQENMLNFLRKNLPRPRGPRQHGRVLVNLIVAVTGEVTEVQVAPGHGLSPAHDAAAVECVRRLPRFKPGRREGRPVPTALTLPVNF